MHNCAYQRYCLVWINVSHHDKDLCEISLRYEQFLEGGGSNGPLLEETKTVYE